MYPALTNPRDAYAYTSLEWFIWSYYLSFAEFSKIFCLLQEYQLFRDERCKSREQGYNSRNQSLLSKHLKVVKIICRQKQDEKVERILKILCTHGVPSKQIVIQ